MKLGLIAGYSGRKMNIPMEFIKRAETLGYDSVWTSEAYGSDAVSPAAWILANTDTIKVGTAIMQMPARTPAMTAMTAMSLADLSGGRFIVGLGASGPQVIEGWHGVAYGRPVTRLKEYVAIMKQVFAREGPLHFQGKEYQIPYEGERATGLGKPLKSILHCGEDIPIYAATLTPAGVEAAAEVADGFFPVWMDPEQYSVFEEPINKGFAAAGDKSLLDFDVAPFVTAIMGDDVEECMKPIRGNMALYIGGMGARGQNFYTDYAKRLGFEEDAIKIQDLFLEGRKDEAMAAVPAELIDACHLVGPADRIKDRLQRWIDAGKQGHVSSMLVGSSQPEVLELIAGAVL
ncbi:MAG: LLM class F420-dependent oxidoreductase [Gammaproteobacteria bacterium]|nr:MAG: LLM class F420-dependent oxidoreductase [Gammaproteobacteria bacterium]TDJ38054.1 MAG: LLM class F420-dependent oxidoreductase [Gammaproteobacteria bacterium]